MMSKRRRSDPPEWVDVVAVLGIMLVVIALYVVGMLSAGK